MTILKALNWANKKLKPLAHTGHYDTPALDAEILLAFALKKPKEFLFVHPEKGLTTRQWNHLQKLVTRRAKHEPVAYIIGHKEFFDLDFFVDKNVLIPRPETELLIEEVIRKVKSEKPVQSEVKGLKVKNYIIDVGTGSGCIIISLAKNLQTYQLKNLQTKFFATEISSSALKVARKNARHHKVAVTFLRGNLLEPIVKRIKYQKSKIKKLIVVANLPYLTTQQWKQTQPEIKKYEPRLALDGGTDGLKYHRQLFQQLSALSAELCPSALFVFIEIDPSQTKSAKKLIHHHFPTAQIQIKKDLAGRDRLVVFEI